MPTTGRSGSACPNRFSIAPDRNAFPAHGSATTAPEAPVMMQIPGAGPFVRALLVVRLTGRYAVTYGVWAGVHPSDLQRVSRVSWAPE